MIRALVAALAIAIVLPSEAKAAPRVKTVKRSRAQAAGADPARWFATRQGLIRVYQERSVKRAKDGQPAQSAGASCEVIESKPRAEAQVAQTRELCTMIVGRKPRTPTELTYELRQTGVFMVKALAAGKAQATERLLLPGPLRVGSSWNEARGAMTLARRVKSAGGECRVDRRSFGDCLVVAVVQKRSGRVVKRYTETYAAGVGLVEDAQWRLIDVQGL